MSKTITANGHSIELSNLEKVYFPRSGIVKKDIVDYYRRIAPHMLPHISERPITLHRFPDGIDEEGFYQQEVPDYFPDWIERVKVEKEGGTGTTTHALLNSAAGLIYMANQGSIVFHAWLSRRDDLNRPDRLVIDLDPPEEGDLSKLRLAALRLRELFQNLDLYPCVTTTGSAGYHIYVPLERELEFDDVREFAKEVAGELARRYRDDFTLEQRKNKREGRIFLDTLRNSYAHTAVAPYSVRAKPDAPVATPLSWKELESRAVEPQRYTVKNIFRRLAQIEDPWRELNSKKGSLVRARKKFEKDK